MEKIVKQTPLEVWGDKELKNYEDIRNVIRFFDVDGEGERLFCRTKDGKIIEIDGWRDSPIQPYVIYVEWVDFGKKTEKAVPYKEEFPEFLARQPKVVDSQKVAENQES